VSISITDLEAAGVDQPFEALQDAVQHHVDGWSPNLAVISEPFAGRDLLMDYVEEILEAPAERVTFDGVRDGDLPDIDGHEVVLLDDCQYLYTREIGGFERLDRFLEEISASDAFVVASWNRYAWDYLAAVRDVDDVFSTTVAVPTLTAEQMAALLTSNDGDSPAFVQTGAAGRVKTIGFDRRQLDLPGSRSFELPVPELNLEYLASRSLSKDDDVEDVEAVVFQKIAQLSNGNPGVATAVWERGIRDGEIAPAYVEEVDQTLDIDDDEAFVLEVLLAKGTMARSTLDAVLENIPVHRALQSLHEQGVLEIDEEFATIDPEYLYAVDNHLTGRRLIW